MPQGFTLWFTGLSGSGKSTLADAVAETLRARGRLVELLDGDVVRQHLSKGLSFSKEDRDVNIRRIAFVASLITRHGGVAITAAISPYRAIRDEARALIGRFVEVYAQAPLEACEARDPKGLYKKARAGELKGFTGIDDPYEAPQNPEITIDTTACTPQEGAAQIVARLEALGYLNAAADGANAARAEHEFLPEDLLARSEAALRKAGRVHTEVLMREFHVGFPTAARILDRLAEKGVLGLK